RGFGFLVALARRLVGLVLRGRGETLRERAFFTALAAEGRRQHARAEVVVVMVMLVVVTGVLFEVLEQMFDGIQQAVHRVAVAARLGGGQRIPDVLQCIGQALVALLAVLACLPVLALLAFLGTLLALLPLLTGDVCLGCGRRQDQGHAEE